MTINPLRTVRGIGCLVLLAGLAGCERVQPKVVPPPPPRVSVSLPVTGEVTDYEEFPGRTDAVMSVEIRSRVTGYLTKVHFTDGDEVTKDTLLFEIDSSPYDAELARAEATVVQSEAHLRRLEADYRRSSNLYSRGNISREEFDRAAGDRAEAEASVGIALASRKAAQLDVDFTKIKAPISGRLSRRLVDPGNLVKADETPLTTIVSLDPVYLYFDIDERTVLQLRRLVREGKIKSRTEAEIPIVAALSDEDNFPHKGIIDFSENKVDPSTGTLRVRASLENPKPRVLSPGLFMRVRLPIGSARKALMVPEQALGSDQGKKYLYVVDEKNEVVYRPVKVGRLDRGLRVIEEGVSPQERVVVSGLQRVRPGSRVNPTLVDEESRPRTASEPPVGPGVKTAAGS
ncbi:MAG: efflux RND transporter periplasmic adaptor subunit [Isosphaeraceae bacterium]